MSAASDQPPTFEQHPAADSDQPFRATVHTRGRLFWLRRRFVVYIGWVQLAAHGVWLQEDEFESVVLFPWATVESVVPHGAGGAA